MNRIIGKFWITLLAMMCMEVHAQTLVDCEAGNIPCTVSGPANTASGDAAYVAFGKVNAFMLNPVVTNGLVMSGSYTGPSATQNIFGEASTITGSASTAYNANDFKTIFNSFGGSASGSTTGFHIETFFNNSSTTGNYTALKVDLDEGGGSTPVTGNDVGGLFNATLEFNQGGTSGSYAGALTALNPAASLNCNSHSSLTQPCSTYIKGFQGEEIDITAVANTIFHDKIGLNIAALSNDAVAGTWENIGIAIDDASGTPGWDMGIAFGDYDGFFPMQSAGTMIGCWAHGQTYASLGSNNCGTVALGLDWRNVTFTTYAIAMPGFTLDPSGNITGLSLNVTSPPVNTYSENLTGGSITSGATGFGRNITGTVNDSTSVDGIIDFANITCTDCNSTNTYLVDWQVGGSSVFNVNTNGSLTTAGAIAAGGNLSLASAGSISFSSRTTLTAPSSATLQLGTANAASPVNQFVDTQGSRGGTDSNVAGANLTIQSGLGTGNATGSTLTFKTPHAGSSGTTQQTATAQITIGDATVAINQIATGTDTYAICSDGSFILHIDAANCITSSARFKTALELLTDENSQELMGLTVEKFNRADAAESRDVNAKTRQVGLIAENVADVAPECAVYEQDMKTPKSYRPECITALMVKVVQNHQHLVARMQMEIFGLMAWCAGLTFWAWRHRVTT